MQRLKKIEILLPLENEVFNMRKVILLVSVLAVLLLVVSCEPVEESNDEAVFDEIEAASGEENLAGEATRFERNLCGENRDCKRNVIECYQSECRALRGADRRECIDDCFDGALCSDSDGGHQVGVQGTTNGMPLDLSPNRDYVQHTDYCFTTDDLVRGEQVRVDSCEGDNCYVQEGACAAVVDQGAAHSVHDACPGGCTNGACVEDAVPVNNQCTYQAGCGEIEGIVLTLPLDNGVVISRGLLTYQPAWPADSEHPNNHFALGEFRTNDTSGNIAVHPLGRINLGMCETAEVDWPIDDCYNCTVGAQIRFVGAEPVSYRNLNAEENDEIEVALVEVRFVE